MPTALRALALLVLLSVTGWAWGQAEPTKGRRGVADVMPQFEAIVKEAMAKTGVPGVAVAIIDHDQIVLKGFGVRRAGEEAAVDPDTVFQIASVSKPFTTTALAVLVSEGKLKWDDRISDLTPAIRLSDPWISSELRVRDLLCHRSGLPAFAGDMLEDLGYDRPEVLRRLRFLKSGGAFRADYAYTNFGFTLAADSAARSVGTPWEDLIAEKLFKPLGMTATSARFADFEKVKNRAALHVPVDGKMAPRFVRDPDAQSPAGGVSTSARDIAQWLRLHLANGQWNGKPLIAPEVLHETYRPHMVTGFNPATFSQAGLYALGWNVRRDADGRSYLNHSGAFTLGIRSIVALEHKEQAGIAILTNAFPSGLPEALADVYFDLLHHGKVTMDWVAFERKVAKVMEVLKGPERTFKPPEQRTPALPASAYTGAYQSDFFGTLEVVEKDGSLFVALGPKAKRSPLKHYNRDVFIITFANESVEGPGPVLFRIGAGGKADQVFVEAFKEYGEPTFTRAR